MQRLNPIYVIFALALALGLTCEAQAFDLESRYAVITYSDDADLRKFNRDLYMGRLNSSVDRSQGDTVADEVVSKINLIVEKVMLALDMFPPQLKFFIVIHSSDRAVQAVFKQIYAIDVDYIAFYSPAKNTVFYSAEDISLRVVAHEIGHVVAENYFTISPPQRIHEVLAQFAEQHVTD